MYTSNQFPVKQRVRALTGQLLYFPYDGHPGQILLSGEPWWKLEQEKKRLICRGYDRNKFKKTY